MNSTNGTGLRPKKYTGPADPTTPCTFVNRTTGEVCGGPTYTFATGSIWCPDEDAHPGGFFVRRVAFESNPNDTGVLPMPWAKKAKGPKPEAPKAKPAKPAYGGGYDDFIGKGK